MKAFVWVSCARRFSDSVGTYRHLIKPGDLTTKCGATATHADIWRRDGQKPKCPRCEQQHHDYARTW